MNAMVFQNLEARRHKLGMSKAAIAKRARVSRPTVERILLGKETNPRLGNIEAIAAALGVTIRLGATTDVQETQDAHEFRKARAQAKAKRLVRLVQGNMSLEAQGVDSKTLEQMVEQTACELMAGPPKRLWDD
jgi:transcriptional regulator with XRE-family HTH domain